MAVNLTGIFSDAANLLPSQNDLISQLIAGAAGTVVISGLQSAQGQDAVDPMHLFHKPAQPATPTAPAQPAQQGVIQGGQVMLMSKFIALTPDQQKMIQALGYTIIPG